MLTLSRILICLLLTSIFPSLSFADSPTNIPILCYHNLSPTTPGSMNMTPKRFEEQIKWLKDSGFTIIPLKEAVAYLQGKQSSLPPKPIVVTADDGWKSVYNYMLPIVRKYNIPVTLFIYPQTISEGKNAMTWEQLKELQQTKLFDIQSHTWDHPNFKHAKKRMSADKYTNYVDNQLTKSKKKLEAQLGIEVTLLAWPFGIYDDYLEQRAAKAGYTMAFTIDARTANKSYQPMGQPRFMIINAQSQKTFMSIAKQSH